MKFLMMLMTMILTTSGILQAQSDADLKAIQTTVTHFMEYGDQQNAKQLDAILHPEFRTVANRLFGAEEVSLMSKSLYLDLIRTKKIGGDERQLYITQLDVIGNNATVKATMHGKALRFTTFLTLVKSPKGAWTIVGDFPHIEKV